MTRARKQGISINVNWNQIEDKPDEIGAVTFETLAANGDVGSQPGQVAEGNHDHEIGDMVLLFNNQLI
jgi:hypothetical protein